MRCRVYEFDLDAALQLFRFLKPNLIIISINYNFNTFVCHHRCGGFDAKGLVGAFEGAGVLGRVGAFGIVGAFNGADGFGTCCKFLLIGKFLTIFTHSPAKQYCKVKLQIQ